jgi:hypothetical protein
MIALRWIPILAFGAVAYAGLDEVRTEPDARKRYQKALDYASAQIDEARKAYQSGAMAGFRTALGEVRAGAELCDETLRAPGRNSARNLGQFKKAEIRLREILRRLEQLSSDSAVEDRKPIEQVREPVQRIQNQLLVDITSRRKL